MYYYTYVKKKEIKYSPFLYIWIALKPAGERLSC